MLIIILHSLDIWEVMGVIICIQTWIKSSVKLVDKYSTVFVLDSAVKLVAMPIKIFSNETYNEVRIGKYVSYIFC
jgi:hypothetical protein